MMEALYLKTNGVKKGVSRELLKSTSQHMIRKDLEIFRIQDTMFDLFNEVEFFSRCDDEFLSVDQTIQFAYGKNIEGVDQTLVALISDCAMAMAFDYRSAKKNVLAVIDINAAFLADLIFKASEKDNDEDALFCFLAEFESRFPHLNMREKAKYINHVYAN